VLKVKIKVLKKSVKVKKLAIKGVPKKNLLKRGRSYTLKARITPSNATGVIPSWSSSNTRVVKVDSMTGRVTALKKGTAKLKLRAGGRTQTVKVKVK